MARGQVVHQGEGGGIETLPPAGDERREVLAKRADALEEKAEEMGRDGGAIRPDAFTIENEIGAHFDHMDPPHKRPDYAYKWEFCGDRQSKMQHVLASQSKGWERVTVKDDDARGMEHCQIAPDGSIVVGDVLLMRMRKDRYIMLRRQEYLQVQRREQAVDSELRDKADRYGVRVFEGEQINSVNSGWTAQMEAAAKRAAAMKMANQQLDQQIRQGTVPGRPVRGAR